MKKVVDERIDIAFYIKLYPLKIHPGAYEKSKAILCEKSLFLLEEAFAGRPVPKPSCETSVVDENIKLAERLGINSLPSLILPDGRVMPGYRDAQAIKDLLGS
jgi:thiol:disulfide interchange protein DsbC